MTLNTTDEFNITVEQKLASVVSIRLHRHRRRKKMSRRRLSSITGVPARTIAVYEHGLLPIPASTLWLLCKGLGLPPAAMFTPDVRAPGEK